MPDTQGNVTFQLQNNVGEIRFSHPKANCLTAELLSKLTQAVHALGADPAAKVIALLSDGNGSFCSGASFDEFQRITTAEEGERFFNGFASVILAMRSAPKFVVTRVQGKVVGGGLGLVAASDYSVAAASAAAKLSEFELGIGPFTIGPAVARKIGEGAFAAMSIDCEWRDAKWMYERGFYSFLCDDNAALDARFQTLLAKLAASSVQAAAEIKKMFWAGTEDFPSLLAERARTSGRLILNRRPAGGTP